MSDDSTLTVFFTLTASPSAPKVSTKLAKTATPSQLRVQAAEATRIPLASLRLIFRGRLIGDDETKSVVEEYKLEEDSVLHCMGKPAAVEAPPAAAAPVAAAAGSSVSILPPVATPAPAAGAADLPRALQTLRSSNSPSVYLTAVTTLQKVIDNIINNPMEEKYRKVKKQNAAFQRRLGGLPGAEQAMLAAGFVLEQVDGEAYYVIQASADAWPKLLATKATVAGAVSEAQASQASTAPPPAALPAAGLGNAPGGFGSSMPGGFGGSMPPGGTPEMNRMAQQMMSDPNMMSTMLNNPMVRNYMQNDPRFANNPAMRQQLDALASNPQMMQQMSQMMQDPAMMSRMQQMMGSAGGGGGSIGGTVRAPPPQPNNSTAATGNSSANSGNDQELTEEEMIEEAIRRSLQEG